ncbi:hypothetical protein BB559_006064 [Furculomyces boomerangus]|uniref:Uncharacterized protein n=1 Tax=Furculomyces boomerangus TaxID=61424 RepID=A0A2T9Y4X7_9FUNG|nr:hypothetical protein BB559_006064 [Furculomyces boomerangus]
MKPASNDSVTRWIKPAINKIGSNKTAHSTREISSTQAYVSGVPLEHILPREKMVSATELGNLKPTNTPIVEWTFGPKNDCALNPPPKTITSA